MTTQAHSLPFTLYSQPKNDTKTSSATRMMTVTDDTPISNSKDPETWLKEHGDYLYRYAYVRMGSKMVAEDVVQETFLAALKAVERYDGRSPIRYWLRGILRHKIVDHFRKSSRETMVEDTEAIETMNSTFFKVSGMVTYKSSDWSFNPRKAFEQKEFMDVVGQCVAKLSGPAKDAFVMRELEGKTTEEICEELDVKPNYVWVLLHRARSQLQGCIEARWSREQAREETNDA